MISQPFKGVRAYFLAAWPIGHTGTDVSIPTVFFDDYEARAALTGHQRALDLQVEAGDLPAEVHRSVAWYLQTAWVQGIADHPQFVPFDRAPGEWVSAYPSQKKPGIYRAFAGGFGDFAEVVQWEPFIFAFQRLIAAMYGDRRFDNLSEAVDTAEEEVVWDSLQFLPIESVWMGQAT